MITDEGVFAKTFPITKFDAKKVKIETLPKGIGELSESFSFSFENSGVMMDGVIYTVKTFPEYDGKQITLGDVMDKDVVDEKFFFRKRNFIIHIQTLRIVMNQWKDYRRSRDRHGSI